MSASREPTAGKWGRLGGGKGGCQQHGGSCERGDSSVKGLVGFLVQGHQLLPPLSESTSMRPRTTCIRGFGGVEGKQTAGSGGGGDLYRTPGPSRSSHRGCFQWPLPLSLTGRSCGGAAAARTPGRGFPRIVRVWGRGRRQPPPIPGQSRRVGG